MRVFRALRLPKTAPQPSTSQEMSMLPRPSPQEEKDKLPNIAKSKHHHSHRVIPQAGCACGEPCVIRRREQAHACTTFSFFFLLSFSHAGRIGDVLISVALS